MKSSPLPPGGDPPGKPANVEIIIRKEANLIVIPPSGAGKKPNSYRIYRREEGQNEFVELGDATVGKSSSKEPLIFRDETAQPGATYHYRITPLNSSGIAGEPLDLAPMASSIPPGTPVSLKAEPGDGIVDLKWDVPEGLQDEPQVRYNVYVRNEGKEYGLKPMNREPLTAREFLDVGLTNGVPVYYRVSALTSNDGKNWAEGPFSEEVKVIPIDLMPPAIPVALEAFPGDGGIMLKWWPNHETDLLGFNVYLITSMGPKKLNDKPIAANEYLYKIEKRSRKTYTFHITSVDVEGNESDPSNPSKIRW